MLGTTVPEPTSDGRVFICSAGVSAELRSLMRIYPLARRRTPPRWSVNCVCLERNPKDMASSGAAHSGSLQDECWDDEPDDLRAVYAPATG